MHDASCQHSSFRLAIAPGVSSSHLSALLGLQREEEPEVDIAFFEVAGGELAAGLYEGRYDAGISLEGLTNPRVKSLPLWTEAMAVAMPPRFHLFDQAMLTIADLQDYPVYRWPAEICPLLDEKLSGLMPVDQANIQRVTSFEMVALWVAAGYGIGISAQSRIELADEWGITMRPLADGPYEIVTHLQRPHAQADSVSERFERRAMRVVRSGA